MTDTDLKPNDAQISDDDTTHLLLAIFECAIDPQHFSKLTLILEQWLSNDVGNPKLAEMENFTAPIWKSLARAHLKLEPQKKERPPILVIDRKHLSSPTSGEHANFFKSIHLDDLTRLKAWTKSNDINDPETILRSIGDDGTSAYLLARINGKRMQFYNISPEMSAAAKALISKSFGISFTEMLVLQELLSGTKIQDIATHTGKSVETVRSQVKSISMKLGVSRQQDIVKLVTNIQNQAQVYESEARPPWIPQEKKITLRDGRIIYYRVYGPDDGNPVLCMHGFHRASHLPRSSQEAFTACKLKWIVPARAGFGLSDPVLLEGEKLICSHVEDYKEILDQENIEACAILAEGTSGVMACRFAQIFPTMVIKVFGLNIFPTVNSHEAAMAYRSGMYRAGALAALYSPYMLKLITRFVIKRAMQVRGPEQLYEMSGVSSTITKTDQQAYEEYTAPNLHEIFQGKGEGAWRDCTYLHVEWATEDYDLPKPDMFVMMQHHDYPFVRFEFAKEFCATIGGHFIGVEETHRTEHLQMTSLAQTIALVWK